MDRDPLVQAHIVDRVARVTLDRPRRHNSLVPEMLADLNAALADARERDLVALVLAANGRSFSTGGDVAGFFAVPRAARKQYAHALIGDLNRAILALLDMPCPVIARVHGPVTGGSLGLVLAADLVAIAREAFIAPYYVKVGFAPDGGWTAMLPERIGSAKTRTVQLLNHHLTAEEAVALGLATACADASELDSLLARWIEQLAEAVPTGVRATREMLLTPQRRAAIAEGLERERERFVAEIGTDAVEAGMAKFLNKA